MASVKKRTGKDANKDEKEALKSANPGNGRWALVREEGGFIILLIHAERVYETPNDSD